MDNDTRGWIMTGLSGIACTVGASIICVDLIIQQIPGRRNFRIQDSNVFLSSSLSLSFGVMLYSSLYNMLPNSKRSLIEGGFSPKAASWMMIGLFLGGALVIQVLSRWLHHYIPSHAVDCDNSHEDEESAPEEHDHKERRSHNMFASPDTSASHHVTERTALLGSEPQRPSLLTKVSQLVSTTKSRKLCDDDADCHGYSDPCGQDYFEIIQARGGSRSPNPTHPGLAQSASTPATPADDDRQPVLIPDLTAVQEEESLQVSNHQQQHSDRSSSSTAVENNHNLHNHKFPKRSHSTSSHVRSSDHHNHPDGVPPEHHHHHVPKNAFLSIGLQTSLAIALHKLPEGFITYATNHANPKLGFSVFLALFIHNITEGFAMALPLYLAINSRGKAMLWSALLGGVSQPLGAGMAALWFKLSGGTSGNEPGEGVYGCMFAIVAGIMASVALQLFSESLAMTHSKNLCIVFAFVGMAILGISSALTA
ncbi:Zinc/iron permease [Venturia nashicola]|uniref:Zinc/iron permease n=1 Tax=Venturia nashicola TaxID=86259 RepID=A0A4Z1NLF9_9PEZI|nr:Zinc/iron permease [Venturia nashicola]TLD20949.1 Zinc/iron permease [Venturia nashicola]